MSQWAREHPEEMAEIAALPLSQQTAALRAAMRTERDRWDAEEFEPPPCRDCGSHLANCACTFDDLEADDA